MNIVEKFFLKLIVLISYFNFCFSIFRIRHIFVWRGGYITPYRKSLPPHNISIAQGSTHIIACRGFIDYILHSPIAKDLLEWMNDTQVPDELYFATLNHNRHLNVSGAYKGDKILE